MAEETIVDNIENPNAVWIFSEQEKTLISSLVSKGYADQERNSRFDVIDFDSFFDLFSGKEVEVIKKYMAIKPKAPDYKLPYLGLEDTPDNLVEIIDQEILVNDVRQILPYKYLPQHVYDAYIQMRESLKSQTSMDLLVSHGYRSPARQVFLFFDNLVRRFDFDFQKTTQRIFFPAYSEHVFSKRQAIDFVTGDGKKSDSFGKTPEYRWLKENARNFDFIESYPQDNLLGVTYEPWHWSYQPQK